MGSRNPRFGSYGPKTLEALGQAFDATWVMLQTRDPFRDFERDSELKTDIGLKLMALAADGVTDPVELLPLSFESGRSRASHRDEANSRIPYAFKPPQGTEFPAHQEAIMNDPFNSQETAQTRHAYRSVTAKLGLLGLDTAIPERVRNLADKTVGKTREIFDHSVSAFEASVATFERSFDVAGQGAAAFHLKIVDVARRNVETRFDLAKSLAGAKDLTDMVKLQAVNWRKQIDTLTAQADEVRTLSTKVTADSAESIKPQKACDVDGRGH